MAKHALDENRNRREPERPLLQVGHINAGKKFRDVELTLATVALPAAIVGVDVNVQIDIARLHPPIDERLAAIVERASHAELQGHVK